MKASAMTGPAAAIAWITKAALLMHAVARIHAVMKIEFAVL
jgi:hypothetical protein